MQERFNDIKTLDDYVQFINYLGSFKLDYEIYVFVRNSMIKKYSEINKLYVKDTNDKL